MVGKRMESLVPKMTSWMLANTFLRKEGRTLETRVRSDFLRKEEDDMLCAVLLALIFSLLNPFSKSHVASCCCCWFREAMILKDYSEGERKRRKLNLNKRTKGKLKKMTISEALCTCNLQLLAACYILQEYKISTASMWSSSECSFEEGSYFSRFSIYN